MSKDKNTSGSKAELNGPNHSPHDTLFSVGPNMTKYLSHMFCSPEKLDFGNGVKHGSKNVKSVKDVLVYVLWVDNLRSFHKI